MLHKMTSYFIICAITACVTFSSASSLFAAEKRSLARELSKDFSRIAQKGIPAVVSILCTAKSEQLPEEESHESLQEDLLRRFFGIPSPYERPDNTPVVAHGSGFLISSDGKILTNNHVVRGATKITVFLNDGREFDAKLIGSDPNTDIALLKIEADKLPYLEFANSDQLEVAEWVMAIGNPLNLEASVSVGIVSAKGRNNLAIVKVEEFIQTDAAINRGNSGGCLLNFDGDVVGMNTAIASNTGGNMGIGFAIPSNLLKYVTKELEVHGKVVRGFLGVSLQKIDSDMMKAFQLEKVEGALITEVAPGKPAELAGIKTGDIILEYNKQKIDSAGKLRNLIALTHPGEKITIKLLRNGKTQEITVTVGTHPESELAFFEAQTHLGISVQNLTPEIAHQFGYNDAHGVLINAVDPRSTAYAKGLRPGQLIISINKTAIKTVEEFYTTLQELKDKKAVLLHVRQGIASKFISIPLE